MDFELGPLAADAARELLEAELGPERIDREPRAAEQLVGLAGGAPSGLRLAARMLRRERFTSVADFVRRLSERPEDEPGDPWEAISAMRPTRSGCGDVSVRRHGSSSDA